MPNRNKKGNGKLPSIHAGGYSEEKARRLANIPLPEKTLCVKCDRKKNINTYSKTQLDDLRSGLATGAIRDIKVAELGWIKCSECAGNQVFELQCFICGIVKGLSDGFSKAQRKDRDHARCYVCCGQQTNAPPVAADAIKGFFEENASGNDDSDGYGSETNTTVTNRFADDASGVALTDATNQMSHLTMSRYSGNTPTSRTNGRASNMESRRSGAVSPPTSEEDGDWESSEQSVRALKLEKARRSKFAKVGPRGRGDVHVPEDNRGRTIAPNGDDDDESDGEMRTW